MKGFVKQRTDGGSWTAYWETRDPATGQRRQRSKGGFRVKRDAQRHLSSVVGAVVEGRWSPDTPISVGELLTDHWLPAQRSRGLRPKTLTDYAGMVDWYIVPILGGLKAAALTPKDVDGLVSHMRTAESAKGRRGLSPRTVQGAVVVLKGATAWAARNGLLGRDPLGAVSAPRRSQEPMKSWSLEEARAFLAHVRGDALEAAWALYVTRPMRRGEVAGLQWDQVDLAASTLAVTRTRITDQGKALESTPKTVAGRRVIPLDDRLVALLRARQVAQKEERLRFGEAWESTGHVFTDPLGRPWFPDYFSDRFRTLVRDAALRQIRLHDTRHTACSLMIAAGVPVKVVQELAGHASPAITMSLYQHVTPSMGRAAGEQLSASLFS